MMPRYCYKLLLEDFNRQEVWNKSITDFDKTFISAFNFCWCKSALLTNISFGIPIASIYLHYSLIVLLSGIPNYSVFIQLLLNLHMKKKKTKKNTFLLLRLLSLVSAKSMPHSPQGFILNEPSKSTT